MAVVEREPVGRARPYEKLLISTVAAVVAVALAGYFLTRALPGSPALRCVGFVVFGTTSFIAATVWWQVALAAIGHGKEHAVPGRVLQSLGAIVGMVFALSAGEYALYAWTQSRMLEAFAGVVASLIAFGVIGTVETRDLAPPAPNQVRRLRSIARMFVLIAAVIVVDVFVGLRQPQLEHFAVFRDVVLALEFATAPAVLVGAWFVGRRSRMARAA